MGIADREHVADDEHPDHQFRVNRWPTNAGIIERQLSTDPRQVETLLGGAAAADRNFRKPAFVIVSFVASGHWGSGGPSIPKKLGLGTLMPHDFARLWLGLPGLPGLGLISNPATRGR
jgi:hypothetical protein